LAFHGTLAEVSGPEFQAKPSASAPEWSDAPLGAFGCLARLVGGGPLICLLAVAATGLALIPGWAGAATEKKRFVAWENGEPALPVESRRDLDCNSSSYVNTRSDAWRCFGRRFIYDPCFENLAEEEFGELFCVRSPWANSGVLAFSALDYDDRFGSRDHPWALVTNSGKRCRFISGASSVSHGRRLNYFCHRPSLKPCPCVYGLPDRSRPTWRIFVAGLMGRNWHREKVRVAWR